MKANGRFPCACHEDREQPGMLRIDPRAVPKERGEWSDGIAAVEVFVTDTALPCLRRQVEERYMDVVSEPGPDLADEPLDLRAVAGLG